MSRAPYTSWATIAAAVAPGAFVVLWSTGFIGARLTMPYAEPMTLLALRFAIAAGLLAGFAALIRSAWPRDVKSLAHLSAAGLLLHAIYLGGVFAAVRLGLEAGVSALIVGVQPVLTAALAGPILREKVGWVKWSGLMLGAAGVALVVGEKLAGGSGSASAVGLCAVSLVAIAAGTVYQKRFCAGQPIFTGAVVQYLAAALFCGALALPFETGTIRWTGELVFGLIWLILVLSCGAVCLLYWLIRHGAAANVASLFFLVPPCAAVMGYLIFGEAMGPQALAGMALAGLGVALVNRRAAAR